jgi:hypothetical protein
MPGLGDDGKLPECLSSYADEEDAAGVRPARPDGVNEEDPEGRVCRTCKLTRSQSTNAHLRRVGTGELEGFDDESCRLLDSDIYTCCLKCRRRRGKLAKVGLPLHTLMIFPPTS